MKEGGLGDYFLLFHIDVFFVCHKILEVTKKRPDNFGVLFGYFIYFSRIIAQAISISCTARNGALYLSFK